jgi:hypothetical protein
LPDVSGKTVSLADHTGQPVLVMFICNHCPYVKHVRTGLAQLGRDLIAKGVAVIAISSNDAAAYPDDSPEKMRIEHAEAGYTFPYLYDATQETGKSYTAACTPDFFLFDASHRLVYRGQMDDSRPGNGVEVTGKDLRAAVDNLLAGQTIDPNQKASLGCNIKWRPGNEPSYF